MKARSTKRLSSCDGKQRFDSFALAERIAHQQARHREGKFVAYPCNFCAGFHIGTTLGEKARAMGGFDGRHRYAVYVMDDHGREALVGFTNDKAGGHVAEIIKEEPTWRITRIVDRYRRAA
jgi:hypothetical protein